MKSINKFNGMVYFEFNGMYLASDDAHTQHLRTHREQPCPVNYPQREQSPLFFNTQEREKVECDLYKERGMCNQEKNNNHEETVAGNESIRAKFPIQAQFRPPR